MRIPATLIAGSFWLFGALGMSSCDALGSRVLWKFQHSCAIPSMVVGPDGTTYIADSKTVEAVEPDGRARWQVELGAGGSTYAASLALGPDAELFVLANDELRCYNPAGELRWQRGTAEDL